MGKVFTAQQFIDKLKWLVNDVPNYYYSGSLWLDYDKSNGKFRMDCLLSVKGLFWQFKADKSKARGGAIYKSNGVPDFSCNGALNYCSDVSSRFDNLVAGEYVCMKGTKYNHTGACIKPATSKERGLMFEVTSSSAWGVKKAIISEFDINGNRYYKGVRNLKWTYHGKLQWVDYSNEPKPKNQVMIWQEAMNKQWNCGLAVDGSFGPACTKEATKHYLHYGIKAPIMVKWLQTRLKELGYSLAVDGSFGPDCRKKVKDAQKRFGLAVDGSVGPATSRALTE